MLSTEEFAKWSDKVVLFLHNTSRVDSEPYPNLLYEMGGIGFPTVSYLDAEGRLRSEDLAERLRRHVLDLAEFARRLDHQAASA